MLSIDRSARGILGVFRLRESQLLLPNKKKIQKNDYGDEIH